MRLTMSFNAGGIPVEVATACLGEKSKRTRQDSNLRHSVPKTDALIH